VQFDHRLLATLTALVSMTALAVGFARPASRTLRLSLLALAGIVALQYALGVATLLAVVPVGLASAHQGVAMLVLTAALVALHRLRHAARDGT
jgi:cytochrome c oxidase assembly protein subunit 15